MIKCIATDMDGTLLNSRQEVSEANKQAIRKARELGIEVVIATGRSWYEARFALEKADIDSSVICVNGGEIRNEDGDILFSQYLSGPTSIEVAEVLDREGIYFELYSHSGTYTANKEKGIQSIVDIHLSANPSANRDEVREKVESRFGHGLIEVVEDYDPFFNADDARIQKFLAFSLDDDALKRVENTLNKIDNIHVTSSGRHNIEVTHREAQKGIALEMFAKQKGISLENTMAIGDNYNDLSMLEKVGYSVAMGNASQDIKNKCKFQTTSNNEDGVANAIMMAINQSTNPY